MIPRRDEPIELAGSAGRLEVVIDAPPGEPRAIALVAHPHPLYGGTLDNKVAQTLATAFAGLGCAALRMNFRGVGRSEGVHDEGRGETDDMAALAEYAFRRYGRLPVYLAGFSFGCFVQYRLSLRLEARKLVFVAPAVRKFPMGDVPAGTLVIHGEVDETAPLADVLDWARPQNLPVCVVPGADHFFHRRLAVIRQLVDMACRL
jgi:uncharacterized protein